MTAEVCVLLWLNVATWADVPKMLDKYDYLIAAALVTTRQVPADCRQRLRLRIVVKGEVFVDIPYEDTP